VPIAAGSYYPSPGADSSIRVPAEVELSPHIVVLCPTVCSRVELGNITSHARAYAASPMATADETMAP